MKLVFKRDADKSTSVYIKSDEQVVPFKYLNMIKDLIKFGPMEEPDIEGVFTATEEESIKRMVGLINEEVKVDGRF